MSNIQYLVVVTMRARNKQISDLSNKRRIQIDLNGVKKL